MSRRIAREIREEIVNKVQAGERVADLAEQYAVSAKTIYGWLRQDTGEAVISVLQYNKLKRENEELKRLIGELTLNMHLQKKSKQYVRPGSSRCVRQPWGSIARTSIVSSSCPPKTMPSNSRSKWPIANIQLTAIAGWRFIWASITNGHNE